MAETKTAPTTTKRGPRTIAGTAPAPVDAARTQTLALYEGALRLMQEGKYDKANVAFDKMLASAVRMILLTESACTSAPAC